MGVEGEGHHLPPYGTDPRTWLKKLIEIIAHAYFFGEGVMFLPQEALHALYQGCGMYEPQGPHRTPTLREVLKWLREYPAKGRQALWMDSTLRGIQSLCFGHVGGVLNAQTQTDLASLLERGVILELDALTNADKTFPVEALLLWIHHYRLEQGRRESFKHALIIEEAHHVLLRRGAGRGGEAITDTILREIRELGEAVILVDQHPSLISLPALGNTYTTLAMNLNHKSDVNAVSAAMLLGQEGVEILGHLPVGWAILKLQGRWTQPFVVRIPHLQLPKGRVTDETLAQLSERWDIIQPSLPQTTQHGEERTSTHQAPAPTPREETLLLDVARYPLSGVVERYRRLKLNRRKGNAAKEACLAKGFLRQVPIPTRSGRVVMLELSQTGRDILREKGHVTEDARLPPRRGELEHEYWRQRVATTLRERGYEVYLEEPVNGCADLVAEMGDRRIAWRSRRANPTGGRTSKEASEARSTRLWWCAPTNTPTVRYVVRQDRWSQVGKRLTIVRAQLLPEVLSSSQGDDE